MKKMLKKKTSGFTLIELMIVVAIIGILAAIAIPNFIRYQLKSKEAEAKTVIGGIRTANEAFRAEYDVYVQMLPIEPPGMMRNAFKEEWSGTDCPATCARGDANVGMCTEYECIGYKPSGPTYFDFTYATTALTALPDFRVEGTSDLDVDGMLNYHFYSTDNDADRMLGAGLADCTGMLMVGASPELFGEIFDCEPQFF